MLETRKVDNNKMY